MKTRLVFSGVGEILDKSALTKVNNVSTIGLRVSTERSRNSADGKVSEEDVFNVRFWATGADVINNGAEVGDTIWISGELRHKQGIELKVNHFEIYKDKQ